MTETAYAVAKPLNPMLYEQLKSVFGRVGIEKQGQPFVPSYGIDPWSRKPQQGVAAWGEYYKVACPMCGDRQQHLYFNHRYGTVDPAGRRFGMNLVICFRSHCEQMVDDFHNLLEMKMSHYCDDPPKLNTAPPDNDQKMFRDVEYPENCVPLGDLPESHLAVIFARERKFDPVDLANRWGVRYCEKSVNAVLSRRLIIPIHWCGKMVGFQARSLDGSKPKYMTQPAGMPKSRLLFNGDTARHFSFGIVCEGPLDVFRLGDRAVALLGSTMSNDQNALIHAFWSDGAVCVLLDGDMPRVADKLLAQLKPDTFRRGAFTVRLPGKAGPSKMDRHELEELIANAARSRGVVLTAV